MSDDWKRNSQEKVTLEWERLERAEHALWRNSILLLVALAFGLALVSWEAIGISASPSRTLSVGLVVLVVLFGVYVWIKKRELGDLRGLLRDLHEAAVSPPTEAQFEKLLEIVSRSQHGYRELIDSLDHAVFTLAPDGVIRVANRFMAQILSVAIPDLIGHAFDEFVSEPSRAVAEQALPQLLAAGSWTGRIAMRPRQTRELRYFECRFQAVRSEGELTGISGWARDVTALHESEIRFQELFESLREGIFFTSPEGDILDANPALVRMLGFATKEELKAHNFREFYLDPARRDALVMEMQETGSAQDSELELRAKDGRLIRCLASGFAIRDVTGRLIRLQGTLVDVTERFEIKRRLHEEQEFVRRLIDNFPDIIAVLDMEGRFTYISPRVQDTLGQPPEDYIGKILGEYAHPDDMRRVQEMFESVKNGRTLSGQAEYRTRHANGAWRTLRATAGPLFDASGKIHGVVASARDVTDAVQAEHQTVQREKLASMGQMMAGAAHELNNPLTAILGVSDLLRERAADDSTRRQTEIVLQQARRAAGIVQNLLAFSRPLAQGRGKIQLAEIVQRALAMQRTSLEQKKIAVELDCAAGLPTLEGDAKLLMQVFSNLIVNAEQAISSSRDHGKLKISLSSSAGNLVAVFADDGTGIAPENLRRIFDPFFTTKRPGGGTGLGLTICLAVAKEHGGRIEVQSTPGNGATFRVILPVATEILPAGSGAIQRSSAATPISSALVGHSALVVDDEESIREIVQEGLSARGMKVEGAASAEEALMHIVADTYDVILCDYNLPGLNGEQLFEKLRAKAGKSTPRFVFMTGDMLDTSIVTAFGEKGAHVMQKPFHVAALATLLAEILQPQPAKVS